MVGALNQIKEGAYQLRKAAEAPPRVAAAHGPADLISELKAKPIRLRKANNLTASGRFVPVSSAASDRSGSAGSATPVGIPGVKGLRKVQRRPEPPKEMSEIEKVREKMAKKMQARLREMEEQDVAASWDEDPDEQAAAAPPAAQAAGAKGAAATVALPVAVADGRVPAPLEFV
jgi:hypothetical protein